MFSVFRYEENASFLVKMNLSDDNHGFKMESNGGATILLEIMFETTIILLFVINVSQILDIDILIYLYNAYLYPLILTYDFVWSLLYIR